MSTISVDKSVSNSTSLTPFPYKIEVIAICLIFKHFFKLLNINDKKNIMHKLLKDLGFLYAFIYLLFFSGQFTQCLNLIFTFKYSGFSKTTYSKPNISAVFHAKCWPPSIQIN